MDCKQADRYIMQYGENTIEPSDAHKLTKHLLVCEGCRESFVAFDICLEETPDMEAPGDFAQNVMVGIKQMRYAHAVLLQKNTESRGFCNSFGFLRVAFGLGAVLVGALLFFALNFGYSGDFFGTLLALIQYYSVAIMPFFEDIGASLSVPAHFSLFTFIFVPVLSVLLFVLHSTEKSSVTPGDSMEA